MNRLSVENLFPSAKRSGQRPLDVYSLYHPDKVKKDKEVEFSIDNLIKFREKKKKRAEVQYERMYQMCLGRINYVNNMSKTDMIYHIPTGIYRCPDYDASICLKIIEERLRKQHLDTLILNANSIFISWLNVDQNRKKDREEKKEKDDDHWK